MGGLGAYLDAMIEGDEGGAFLLPVWTLGDDGDANVAVTVGRVTCFLEYAEEVVTFIFPSAVNVYGVL
jgi:hypothetical protein